MRKFPGLVLLAISAAFLVALSTLSALHLVFWGPCGPDPLGLVLLCGFLLTGAVGGLFTFVGLLKKISNRIGQSD